MTRQICMINYVNFRKKASSTNSMGKIKGYQPQISLNKKTPQDNKSIQSFINNNQNLIDFNANTNNQIQDKQQNVTGLPISDLISFTYGNETPSITGNSKKPSEFNFINSRKTNSTQNLHSNLIDVNSDTIPIKLKALHENINKLYSNTEQNNYGSLSHTQNMNNSNSSFNTINQQNTNNNNNPGYSQFYDNSMNNQMRVGVNNFQTNTAYNQYNSNPNMNNSYNSNNKYNSYNQMNNMSNMSNINAYPGYGNITPQNNFNNQVMFNGNYQGNINNYNDYTFGLTPSVPQPNNYYINLSDEKAQKGKNEDPFKNLVSFK